MNNVSAVGFTVGSKTLKMSRVTDMYHVICGT